MTFRQTGLPLALSALLLSAPALGEADFSAWDEDGDGRLSMDEWGAAIEEDGLFDRLDENGNGVFDVDEADEGVFDYDLSYDLDDGGHIERQEFAVGAFGEHDENEDEYLDEEEFEGFSQKYGSSDLASN